MINFRDQFQKPLNIGLLCFVAGLVIGWFIIGWGLWPVEWEDAAAQHLRQDAKVDYLRMAIDSFRQNPNPDLARQRWTELNETADAVLAEVEANPLPQDITSIAAFKSIVIAAPSVLPEEPSTEDSGLSPFSILLIIMLVSGGIIAAILLIRRQRNGEGFPSIPKVQEFVSPFMPEPSAPPQPKPVSQYMTTYMLGDDLFDDSFAIDSPSGEFLGECGVGISEQIGVGDPKKVTAFEVWLFDKNDIQTVTKVLMSGHAYYNEQSRSMLATKGEPVLAEVGSELILETASMRLVARIVDMEYGEGPLPEVSFFDRLTVELAAFIK